MEALQEKLYDLEHAGTYVRPGPDVLAQYAAAVRAIACQLQPPELPSYCLRVDSSQDRLAAAGQEPGSGSQRSSDGSSSHVRGKQQQPHRCASSSQNLRKCAMAAGGLAGSWAVAGSVCCHQSTSCAACCRSSREQQQPQQPHHGSGSATAAQHPSTTSSAAVGCGGSATTNNNSTAAAADGPSFSLSSRAQQVLTTQQRLQDEMTDELLEMGSELKSSTLAMQNAIR